MSVSSYIGLLGVSGAFFYVYLRRRRRILFKIVARYKIVVMVSEHLCMSLFADDIQEYFYDVQEQYQIDGFLNDAKFSSFISMIEPNIHILNLKWEGDGEGDHDYS
jgi:hypothetical protein